MTGKGAHILFSEGEKLYATLEKETRACLENLWRLDCDQIGRFVARRQEILSAIQEFHIEFNRFLNQPSRRAEPDLSEEFRRRLSELLRRIIEEEGILRALAEKEMAAADADLNAIGRGRHALHGYRGERQPLSSALNHSA